MSSEQAYGDPGTRKKILDGAWELLEKSGADVTLSDIARHSGVSRQTIYLHFGDRSGLFVALVEHVDESLGAAALRRHVFGASSGVESLRRWVETIAWYTGKIDRVTEVMERNQYEDTAVAARWRDRMSRRRRFMLDVAQRINEEGRLAAAWTVQEAANLIYVVTMPGLWRESTRELSWSEDEYVARVWRLLERALLTPQP